MAKTGEREKRKQNQSGMEVNYKRQRWCFWLNETSSYWIMSLIVISPQDTQPIRAEGKVLKLKKLIVIMKKTFNFLC